MLTVDNKEQLEIFCEELMAHDLDTSDTPLIAYTLSEQSPVDMSSMETMRRSYEDFYRRNWPIAVGRARRAGTRDPEDVASLTFLAMWRRWEDINMAPPGPVHYLKCVIDGNIVDSFRRHGRNKEEPHDFQADWLPEKILHGRVHDIADGIANLDILSRIRKQLEPAQQTLFSQLAQSIPIVDIAKELGISANTVRTRAARLRPILKEILAKEGYYE